MYADGSVYIGSIKDGKRSGYGKMTYNAGIKERDHDQYEGEWRFNKRHGDGKMVWRDGCKY